MQYRLITLRGHAYSEACAARCEASTDLPLQRFHAVPADQAQRVMREHGIRWTWADNNRRVVYCPRTGLRQHPYGRLAPKIGCSMSHYLLWHECAAGDEPFLILEHDAVFIRPLPDVCFKGICQINDPQGATPFGEWWAASMRRRGPGVWGKTWIPYGDNRPDGLAGNSAYLLKPWAAAELCGLVHKYGLWPNDAIMCRQLVGYLQEHFPFITRVQQTESTSS